MKKVLFFLVFSCLLPMVMLAQVTSGSVTGTVKEPNGQGLEGAFVTVTHKPSGTRYANVTRKDGSFTLNGVRVGGPYQLKVEFVGYKPQIVEGFTVVLGEAYDVNITIGEDAVRELKGVEIGSRKRKAATEKSGASTVIDSRQLSTLPSFNRSITDFTKLTPQSNGGSSFAGRSGYYNNLKVDGANLNNSFGLSTDPVPGGGAEPISLDAFDEISVNIAPVDVRQSGFTGAGINAVTKSGTNEFHGTVFGFYRDQTFNGRKVGDQVFERGEASMRKSFGASLGGPIIKDKLFFFINGEFESQSGNKITNFVPEGSDFAGTKSSTHRDSLAKLSNFLREQYGYETGAYEDFPVANESNYKFLVKLDWNVNNHHKLTAKFQNYVSNEDPSSINGSTIIGGGGFTLPGTTNQLSSLPNSRFSNRSMTFANSVYGFKHIVRSGTLELNSNWRKISNNLLVTISRIRDTRATNSADFPFVDIMDGTTVAHNYMSFGYEPFSFNNDVINKVWNVTDNLTYYSGKHTLTAGFSYEQQMVGNMFMPGAQSYYVYNSLNDFITQAAPLYYSYAYSMIPGKKAVYSAELKLGQLAVYAQDEIKMNSKLKITLGLRIERPVYTEKALENPAITALMFPDKMGQMRHYNGQWPEAQINFSPRIGMRWDVLGDKSLIIRGSTGVFNGLAPFVWLTNMPTNSGMYQNSVVLRNSNADEAKVLADMKFDPRVDAYANLFPPVAGATIPSNIVLVDPTFKFPQIFRTDLAVDKNLGNGWNATFEGLITKDINAIAMRNGNLKDPTGVANGPDNRPRYTTTVAADRAIYPSISSAIIVENTNKGYSYALTAQLSKSFSKGLYGSIAYTYTGAKDVSANSGSQANSIWNSNATVGTTNMLELQPSSAVARHRVISFLSYRLEYLKHAATTVSLIYEGSPNGNITYRLNGDMNRDGNDQDLMFVPNKASDLIFEQYSTTVNGATITFTPEQQAAALEQFINNSPYLKKRRGQYAERNGGISQWSNDLSARVMQEFYFRTGKQKHTLQITADINNVFNLLNKNWNLPKGTTTSQPLAFRDYNADGVPYYRMQSSNGKLFTNPFQTTYGSSNTWSMQLGARYIF